MSQLAEELQGHHMLVAACRLEVQRPGLQACRRCLHERQAARKQGQQTLLVYQSLQAVGSSLQGQLQKALVLLLEVDLARRA